MVAIGGIEHEKTIHSTSAHAFLRRISPTHRAWHRPRTNPASWIFRGHANANWTLTPRALRLDVRRRHDPHGFHGPGSLEDVASQLNFEAFLFRDFLRMADDVGLPLPQLQP